MISSATLLAEEYGCAGNNDSRSQTGVGITLGMVNGVLKTECEYNRFGKSWFNSRTGVEQYVVQESVLAI